MMPAMDDDCFDSLKADQKANLKTKIPRIVISPCYDIDKTAEDKTRSHAETRRVGDLETKEQFSVWTEGHRCSECPLHCVIATVRRPGFPLPKQNGLYGTIADLKSQIQQLQHLHLTEKDSLLAHLTHLEEQRSEVQEKNCELMSQNRWLENKVKFLSALVVTQGPKYESKRSAINVDSTKSSSTRRRPTLRRTKSQEVFGHRSPGTLVSSQSRETNVAGPDFKVVSHVANGSSPFEGPVSTGAKTMSTIEEVDEDYSWSKEKDRLLEVNHRLLSQVHHLEEQKDQLNAEFRDAREQLELMEFRVLELEQCCAKDGNDGRQLESRCVGTDECWESWYSGSQAPDLTNDNDLEFHEEKLMEIRSKILSMVRYHPSLIASDKTTLVQTAAALDVCQNRIRDQRGSQLHDRHMTLKVEASPSSALTVPGIARVLGSEGGQHVVREEPEKQCQASSSSSSDFSSWNSEQSYGDPLLENVSTTNKVTAVDASTNTDCFFDTSPEFISAKISNKIAKPLSNEMGEVDADTGNCEKYGCCDTWQRQPPGGGVVLLDELEKLKCLLMEKHAEMKNKDVEYNLKLEALKCDKEEGQNQLEQRLAAMQERERRIQVDYEMTVHEKEALRQSLDQQAIDFEYQREEVLKQLDEALQQVERWKSAYSVLEKREHQTDDDGDTIEGYDAALSAKDAEIEHLKHTEVNLKRTIGLMRSRWDDLKAEFDSANVYHKPTLCSDIPEKEDEDGEYWLAVVREMISSNSKLLVKVEQLEKKESVYRETLDEADRIVAEAERSYQERLEEMEQSEAQLRRKIERLEKTETQLRQSLKASASRQLPTCIEVKKVGELLERLTESEATEVGLRQKLRQTEQRVVDAETRAAQTERELQEQEDLIRNLENLKRTERALKERIEELETSESALRETLNNADSIMAAREQQLWEQIDALRSEVDAYKKLGSTVQPKESRILQSSEESRSNTASPVVLGHANVVVKGEKFLHLNDHSPTKEVTEELQDHNELEAGIEETYCKHLLNIVNCVKVCPRCLPICGSALKDIQSQVEHLHQVGFGWDDRSSLDGNLLTPVEERDQTLGNCNHRDDIIQVPSDTHLPELSGVEDKYKAINSIRCEMESVVSQLAQRDRELRASTQEVCQLTRFLHNCEEELHKRNTEMSSLALHVAHLQEENEELKRKLWKVEISQAQTKDRASQKEDEAECARKKLADVESKLSAVSKQLRSSEQLQKDKDRLQELCKILEDDLKKTRDAEHRLCAENLHLHHKVEGLRERVSSLQQLKKDHKALLTKHHALEKKLSSTELALEPLQNQIATLRRECWEKDESISRLNQELLSSTKCHCEHQTYFGDLRALKCQSVSQSSDDSGIRDCLGTMASLESETFEDSVLGDVHNHATASRRPISCSPAEAGQSITFASHQRDDCSVVSSDAESLKYRCKDVLFPKGLSASRIPRYTGLNNKLVNGIQNHRTETTIFKDSAKVCVSRSTTRPEGTTSKKVGSLIAWRHRRGSLSSSDGSVNTEAHPDSNTRIDIEQNLKVSKRPSTVVKQENKKYAHYKTSSAAKSTVVVMKNSLTSKVTYSGNPGIPDAPSNFHVTRKVGQDGLLVAWNTPTMDSSGCSNGATVSGYQIFVNDVLHQNVRSAHRTKTLLNNVDLSAAKQPLEISIQTLSLTGQQSAVIRTQYAKCSNDERPPTPPKSSNHIWEAAFQKVGFLKEQGRFSSLQTTDNSPAIFDCLQGSQTGLYMV